MPVRMLLGTMLKLTKTHYQALISIYFQHSAAALKSLIHLNGGYLWADHEARSYSLTHLEILCPLNCCVFWMQILCNPDNGVGPRGLKLDL